MPLSALFDKLLRRRRAQRSAAELATAIADRSTIKNPNSDAFRSSGARAAAILAEAFEKHGVALAQDAAVLDFGSGSGRVALPLLEARPDIRLTAMDVDAEAIEYLALQLPEHCSAAVSTYEPPLALPDGCFDAVYAISVWSHFPEALADRWLQELRRVTRPGAILLLSVAAHTTLQRSKQKPWTDLSMEELDRELFIYREYVNLHSNEKHYPGIAGQGSWGVAAIHPDYIREHWAKQFDVLELRAGGTPGSQDLVILRRPKD